MGGTINIPLIPIFVFPPLFDTKNKLSVIRIKKKYLSRIRCKTQNLTLNCRRQFGGSSLDCLDTTRTRFAANMWR